MFQRRAAVVSDAFGFDTKVSYTVGEVDEDGRVTPYPDAAANRPDPERPQATLVHMPDGVFDAAGRLWLLDAGLMGGSGPPMTGAAKLVCIDIATDRVLRVVPLSSAVVPTSSLNDLRVRAGGNRQPVQGGANGIALSHDGRTLYYAPLMGRRLYGVDTAALLDAPSDAAVSVTAKNPGEKGMTGGLACDNRDRVYLTLQEAAAIARRHADGRTEVLVSDPRLLWPDTVHTAADGWLYVNAAAEAALRPIPAPHRRGTGSCRLKSVSSIARIPFQTFERINCHVP